MKGEPARKQIPAAGCREPPHPVVLLLLALTQMQEELRCGAKGLCRDAGQRADGAGHCTPESRLRGHSHIQVTAPLPSLPPRDLRGHLTNCWLHPESALDSGRSICFSRRKLTANPTSGTTFRFLGEKFHVDLNCEKDLLREDPGLGVHGQGLVGGGRAQDTSEFDPDDVGSC